MNTMLSSAHKIAEEKKEQSRMKRIAEILNGLFAAISEVNEKIHFSGGLGYYI